MVVVSIMSTKLSMLSSMLDSSLTPAPVRGSDSTNTVTGKRKSSATPRAARRLDLIFSLDCYRCLYNFY